MLVTTKSGSNQWHGSLFEFFRNTKLNTRSILHAGAAKVQSEPVWRIARWPDPEGQDVFLPGLSGQDATPRRDVSRVTFQLLHMVTPDANGNYDYSDDPFVTQPESFGAPLFNESLHVFHRCSATMCGGTLVPAPVESRRITDLGNPL